MDGTGDPGWQLPRPISGDDGPGTMLIDPQQTSRKEKLNAPLSWKELGDAVKHCVIPVDYSNGPAISQSRLRLFDQPESAVRVTLYRDNHAWCPYSQKVWMWLEEARIPYRVEKVTLDCFGVKELWYTKLVPSGKVPAIEIEGEDNRGVIEGSDECIGALEEVFRHRIGNGNMSVRDRAIQKVIKVELAMWDAFKKWVMLPARSPAEEAARGDRFVQGLQFYENVLGMKPGPMIMEDFCVADIHMYPIMERMCATVAYYKGYQIRAGGKYPNIDRWMDAMELRDAVLGTMSDYQTHALVVPPLFGSCNESGTQEQKQAKSLIYDGPFLGFWSHLKKKMPSDAAAVCVARAAKHHHSVLKQNPHRHGDADEAFRAAMTYLVTGVPTPPPPGTASSLKYIRDRCSVPRDMPLHSAQLFRHACDKMSKLDPELGLSQAEAEKGTKRVHISSTPVPAKHRLDQEPFAFIKAKQDGLLEAYLMTGMTGIKLQEQRTTLDHVIASTASQAASTPPSIPSPQSVTVE